MRQYVLFNCVMALSLVAATRCLAQCEYGGMAGGVDNRVGDGPSLQKRPHGRLLALTGTEIHEDGRGCRRFRHLRPGRVRDG